MGKDDKYFVPDINNYIDRISAKDELKYQSHIDCSNDEENPLVTVITQTLNSERTLERAIVSIQQQDYQKLEHIVVDGMSTDGTMEIAFRYKESLGAIVQGTDEGAADATNKGISISRGSLICILPSDDYHAPDYISRSVEALNRSKESFTFGDIIYLQDKEDPLLIPGDRNYVRNIRNACPNVSAVSIMTRKACFLEVGLYDIFNRRCPEYDWLIRADKMGYKGVYDPKIRCFYSHGGVSTSDYFGSLRKAREVAIFHGSPLYLAYIFFIIGAGKFIVRGILKRGLAKRFYYFALKYGTRTGVHVFDDRS